MSATQRDVCERCGGSGEIAISTNYPMTFVGSGPVPDDAKNVIGRDCDRCCGLGEIASDTTDGDAA